MAAKEGLQHAALTAGAEMRIQGVRRIWMIRALCDIGHICTIRVNPLAGSRRPEMIPALPFGSLRGRYVEVLPVAHEACAGAIGLVRQRRSRASRSVKTSCRIPSLSSAIPRCDSDTGRFEIGHTPASAAESAADLSRAFSVDCEVAARIQEVELGGGHPVAPWAGLVLGTCSSLPGPPVTAGSLRLSRPVGTRRSPEVVSRET